MDDNKTAVTIHINYQDGTQENIEKGLVFHFTGSTDSELHITADMVNMSGKDLIEVIYACIELGDRACLFDDEENPEEEL